MTLKELEKIVRSNFVFAKSGREFHETLSIPNDWRVDEQQHCNNDMMALIVFCGLAWMLGFTDEDVFRYLEIKRARHTTLLGKFKQALSYHQSAQTHSLFDEISPAVNKMIVDKGFLIMNSIRAHQPKSYINLTDFSF